MAAKIACIESNRLELDSWTLIRISLKSLDYLKLK